MHSVLYCISKRYHFGISLYVSWKECFFCLSPLHYLNTLFLVIKILCLLWANCYHSICGSSHSEFIENHQFYSSKISKKVDSTNWVSSEVFGNDGTLHHPLCLSIFFLLYQIHCVISYYILTLDLPLAYGCGKRLGEFPYVLIVNLFCPILLASSVTSAG